MPSPSELQKLQLAAARDDEEGHLIQQLVNWLNEDRQQVPSLLRQCRVVIRRQLSVALHFQSILPAIEQLYLPDIIQEYLQFDGPLTEVDLSVTKDLQTTETSPENRRQSLYNDTDFHDSDDDYGYDAEAYVSDNYYPGA